MEHLYQIIDCDTAEPAFGCDPSILIPKQIELNNTFFPESQSGDNLGVLMGKVSVPPVYVSPQYLRYVQSVSKHLYTAITDIVSRWWEESDLLSTIPLDPKFERLLRRLDHEGVTWRSGSWRPDFLVEENTEAAYPRIKICEINARFGFNGFFCTLGMANGFYRDDTSRFQPAFSQFDDVFGHVFDLTKPLHVLKGKELGYDIHHLPKVLGTEVIFADISQLRIIPTDAGNRLIQVADGSEIEVSQIVLELHQDELLSLSEPLLWEISIRSRINDMRTIMLVHDKRMLGVVRHQLVNLVTRNVLSIQAAALLENSIAETCLPGTLEYQAASSSDRSQQWLFKPAGSGKGAGIIFRQDIPEEEWQTLLSTTKLSHVLQRAVNHKTMNLVMPVEGSMTTVPWDIVGTFFMVDGYFNGFGPWRSSAEKICALSRGGSWMMGICDRDCLPFPMHPKPIEARRPSRTVSEHSADLMVFPPKIIDAYSPSCGAAAGHVSEVHRSLEENGVALVRLNFSDPQSDYLVSLVRDGLHPTHGHGLPVDHSQKKGWLWDVKPIHGKVHSANDPLARSETMHVFPWHTDCSFEANPPRHFALHVLHADRYGGGSLSLVRTSDIVQELCEETISRLSMPEFVFAVPDEFDKGTSQTLVGALLDMSDGEPKLRFRRDIISPLTKQAELALEELDKVLDECQSSSGRSLRKVMKAEDLPDGMVIVVDNAKWLHARNQVNDPDRHLRRVRWNAQPFPAAA
ncbi:hypothetical protein TWF569_007251 [Orbilia oligospora]|uniref:TauD/TfdA-like domain-containing protein n=1 Tax=Orbilia oligospora TaxID=2813651 RepID=A0A7C8JSQ3_ORBOL|nr:hypothetical protein TWF706_010500 [Orbilia oligospora]KAF3136704.1 hypothetical protein TWF703_005418 [Orbilia oligospora]KAF3143631.1 hypothetical protein TWF569_007251 [Orbilia oligospora]